MQPLLIRSQFIDQNLSCVSKALLQLLKLLHQAQYPFMITVPILLSAAFEAFVLGFVELN